MIISRIMAEDFPGLLDQFQKLKICVIRDEEAPGRCILASAAKGISAETINKLTALSGGIIFAAISQQRYEAFRLSSMDSNRAQNSESAPERVWAVSVEAREGVTTGISAADRARTIILLGDENPNPKLLVSPGHIFPVVCKDGGVLVKSALPEAAVDMSLISGSTDAAAYLDLLDSSGRLMTSAEGAEFAGRAGLPLISLSQIVRHRLHHEKLISKIAEASLPTKFGGEMRSCVYRSALHGGEHMALICGDISGDAPVLTRVQPEFTFADVFGGGNPPTRIQLDSALQAIGREGRGVLVYLRRTNPGSLEKQVQSWSGEFFGNKGASMKEYGIGAQILRDLGVKKIELLTNSKRSFSGLDNFGIEVAGRRPIPTGEGR